MKIGILTLPIAENYGGILQAVALCQFLEQQGHDVSLIYKQTVNIKWKEVIKSILCLFPGHDILNVHTNKKLLDAREERVKLHKSFIDKEISEISPVLYTTDDLINYTELSHFDAVIVGSDQVWRKAYINDQYYKSYFLDFITDPHTKKIAYAASFGREVWEGEDDHQEIHNLLKKFSAISVREASGITICRETFGIDNIYHVLDPTLLMDKQFYLDMISKYDLTHIEPKKLVTYVLDESDYKKNIITDYQSTLHFSDEETLNLKGFNTNKKTYSVPEWLYSIANADFVITDSFHGMVFSIIFEKQFIVIGNKDRGLERFTSLLSLLALEDRLITQKINIDIIDFESVKLKVEAQKKASKNYLCEQLA